jgi:Protein of unknown function (DUF2851)
MSLLRDNFYAQWRLRLVNNGVLRDEHGGPSERLLQAIWQRQRLRRDRLKTTDGQIVRVLHPGFASAEGGPDFCGAVIQFGNERPRAGDVEIDLAAGGWRAHGHDRNPNFQNVVLHVIWENKVPSPKSETQSTRASLPLESVLDAPLAELSLSLENESPGELPEYLRGRCCAPLRELNETKLTGLLNQAAGVRFQNKAELFRARAKLAGWRQALWENLFRALGYKHNAWPMQTLAESRTRWAVGARSPFEFQARLLGVSGLLPAELTRAQKSADGYLRRVWDFWWRERDAFDDCILPREAWKFHGLRPANHPQRRLALAAHWLANDHFISNVERWCITKLPEASLPDSLFEILQVQRDAFWSWHWTFRLARLKKPQPLLGAARVTDLAVNVILPWLRARAAAGKNENIQREVERRFFAWPAAEDNSILKLARQRLLGTASARGLKTAAAQQGLMQIVRDFCGRSNAICENCRFPDLARDWSAKPVQSHAADASNF